MSDYQVLAILAGFAFVYSVIAARIEKTPFSGAVVYLAFGLICGPSVLAVFNVQMDQDGLKQLAEWTLALVLFTDSAKANLPVLRRSKWIPIRLLVIGLPLTIVAGGLAGWMFFPNLTWVEIALLATILAPTDAALGQAVVTNPSVPASVRESLNVESGLNDGICVPVLLIFLSLGLDSFGNATTQELVTRLPLQEIGIGAGVGLALALSGSWLVHTCGSRNWLAGTWRQVPIVALALLMLALAQQLGGSGFIACFVGGLVFGGTTHRHKNQLLDGADCTGKVFSMLTWFLFGAVAVGQSLQQLSPTIFLYAILSLTVLRMVPVMICLLGLKLRLDTQCFIGWFGPRGLASIVFIVMASHSNLPGNETLVAVATWTITLSIIAHGISAVPLATVFGDRVTRRDGAL
jgi:NhaP-type Na+/H+ or K+/H+ antiporter